MTFGPLDRTIARCCGVVLAALVAMPSIARSDTIPAIRDEVVVTASIVPTPSRRIGAAVSVLTADEIELRGYPSLADALRTQPGIAVTNSGGSGKNTVVRIRGEEHFRTLLMIDGVKALDTSAPQVAPSFDSLLSTNDLERVEVLRGPQGFIYGADAGGVVNVLTRRGTGDLGGRVGLEYGEYSTRKLDAALTGGAERGDYYVSLTDFATDGFNTQTADTVLRDDDGDDNTTLHAKLGWNATENLRVQLVARDIDADTAYDGCFSPLTFATVHQCRGTTEQTTYRVSAEHASGMLTHSFGYSSVDIVRDNFAEGRSVFATEGELSRLEYTGSYGPADSLTLVYGLDLHDERIVDADGARSREQRGYYAEYQGSFGQALHVSLGARYDDNDDFGTHTSSRLSVAYDRPIVGRRSVGTLTYRASVGSGFRAPSLFELAYNAGPFALPPAAGFALAEEESRGYDLAVEYAVNGLRLEATYFDQDIEDEIYFDVVSFAGYLQSTGASRSKGLELAAEVPLTRSLSLLANWTNNDAADSANEQRLRRPRNIGNFGLWFRSFNEAITLVANYRLAKDSIDIGGVVLKDYEVIDLSASYVVRDGLEIYGRVQNLTDEDYREIIGHNTAGRAAYAGVRLQF